MKRQPATPQFISEEAEVTHELRKGSTACLDFLNKFKKNGIGMAASELSEQIDILSDDAAGAFLFTLEIFLAGAIQNLDIRACYEHGKTAHQAARAAFIAKVMKENAA